MKFLATKNKTQYMSCLNDYLLENCGALRAFLRPYFFLSFILGSRVKRPADLIVFLNVSLERTNALAIAWRQAPAWPESPPPVTVISTSYLSATSTKFNPVDTINRFEVIKTLYRYNNMPGSISTVKTTQDVTNYQSKVKTIGFTDLGDSSYKNDLDGIVWAYNKLKTAQENKPFYWSDIRALSGVKRENIDKIIPYIRKYANKYTYDMILQILK